MRGSRHPASRRAPVPDPFIEMVPWERVDIGRWERFAAAAPDATYFHTPEWMSIFVRSFPGWRGRVLLAKDAEDGWCALLPFVEANHRGVRTMLSMPFGTFGGPLIRAGCSSGAVDALCSRLLLHARSWNCRGLLITELGNRAMRLLPQGTRQRFLVAPGVDQALDLAGGAEAVWRGSFEPQRRRQTQCARRRGLILDRARCEADFLAYYDLFHEVARSWSSRIQLPRLLFQNLARCDHRRVHLWIARYQGRLVAGNLSFFYRDQAFSWSGVMQRRHSRLHPAVALHHATIEEACACGCRAYHFGPSPQLPDVETFKRQFGCRPLTYNSWAALTPLGRILERVRPAICRGRENG